nr:B3 domain-containing protein Os07g0563300 isoform X1 [Ipomoea batatas]
MEGFDCACQQDSEACTILGDYGDDRSLPTLMGRSLPSLSSAAKAKLLLGWHKFDVSPMVPRANYIKKLLEDRSLSKVLIGPLFVVFDRTSWNRSMKSWSRVLVDSLFTAFNHNSRSRFVESMSRVFINRSSRSRFAERSSAELVNLPFDSLCVQSLIVNPLLIAFNCSSRSRSLESMSTALVVDSVCVGRLPAIPIPNSAMVSRSQSVNFDVVVSTQPSNIHFNSNSKKASEWPRKGLRRRIGESADLCDRCASVHKEEKFCEIFHLNVSGWRSCESCGKQIHCECILSFHTIVLLNAGGIECIICARKSCILTPNLAWPPPSDFLPLQAEGIKDSRSWNPIAGFGPVPSREVQCLNSPFIGQQLQALVIKSSLILDVLVGCSDLDMYSKMSIKEIADNVFEEMPNRKRHWGMHSVDFYNCWNEYQQESSTQIFILSDKPKDANLILVGFRGTESLDVDDWSFADQDIDGRALMLFLLKHKGSNQINFEIGWPWTAKEILWQQYAHLGLEFLSQKSRSYFHPIATIHVTENVPASHKCDIEDHSEIAAATRDPGFETDSKNHHWDERDDCCKPASGLMWGAGYITSLDLSNEPITAGFNVSLLLKLRLVSVIKLDGINFSVPFPDFLSDFTNLTVLSLVDCYFSGIVD